MKEQTERQLIHQDNELLAEICSDLKHYTAPLKALKEAYEGLEMGSFTNEVFSELKAKGTSGIVAAYKKGLDAQLDKTGVTNTKLRAMVLQGSDEPIYKLNSTLTALNEVKLRTVSLTDHRSAFLTLANIAYNDGEFQVYDHEGLLEKHCRVYLEDEESKAIYATLNKVKDALEEYSIMTKTLGVPFNMMGNVGQNLHHFFSYDHDTSTVTLIPASIAFERNRIQRQEAYSQEQLERQRKKDATRIANEISVGLRES